MTGVARPATVRPLRYTPSALLYVGLPAYLAVVGFSVRDLLDSHTPLTAGVGITGTAAFTAAFFWLTFSYFRDDRQKNRLVAIGVMSVIGR